ncbi:putative N-alpha-acetyltransferase 35, NatC auxiliary subunit [Nannochloris sp. 'desiccata']|nr:putative N-alpha-acetyltransferase 35, NatC auxiliary subunit [Chlorella desiccata (nom. nud.)]
MSDQKPHVEHLDVQPFLQTVCDGMQVGELLCRDNFNLHDAMIAVEIGDSKMDVGLRRGDTRSLGELIAAGLAPVDISLESQLAVIDKLMCMEATWHNGVVLSQTVFTSLYLLDTARLENTNPVLHATALGIRSTCTLLHDGIVAGQVVDDEDMLLHSFGFRLDSPGSKSVKIAIAALQNVIETLRKTTDTDTTEDVQDIQAIISRFQFRIILLQLLDATYPATEKSIALAAELCRKACEVLDSFSKFKILSSEILDSVPGFCPEVHRKAMGLVPPRSVTVPSFNNAVQHWKDTLQLLGDACSWLGSCTRWRDLRSNLVSFAATPKNLPIARSLVHRAIVSPIKNAQNAAAAAHAAQAATDSKQSTADGNTDATSNLNNSGAAKKLEELPKWCPSPSMFAAEFGWPSDPASSISSPDAAMFIEQCAIAVQGWCHTMCLNRCRQRRRLRRLLEDWRNMTDHAFNAESSGGVQDYFTQHKWNWQAVDGENNPLAGPVTAWVESEAAKTMGAHIMLGFQLDLYYPYEYCVMYWYCDYLYGSEQGAMEELANMRPKLIVAGNKHRGSGGGSVGKGKKQGRVGSSLSATTASLAAKHEEESVAATSMVLKVDRMMCQAMMRLCLGLEWLNLLPSPPARPFNTEKEHFVSRFSSFEQLIRPPPLSYEDFKRSTNPGEITPQRVLLAAYEALATAQSTIAALEASPVIKQLPEYQRKHVNGMKRIAMQNMMGVKLLVTSLGDGGGINTKSAVIKGGGGKEAPPAFVVGWDFKVAFQHSAVAFYPALVLKTKK